MTTHIDSRQAAGFDGKFEVTFSDAKRFSVLLLMSIRLVFSAEFLLACETGKQLEN